MGANRMMRLLCFFGIHGDGPADLYTRITYAFEVIDVNKGIFVYTCDRCGKRWVP